MCVYFYFLSTRQQKTPFLHKVLGGEGGVKPI